MRLWGTKLYKTFVLMNGEICTSLYLKLCSGEVSCLDFGMKHGKEK